MPTTAQLKATADALEALTSAHEGTASEAGYWRRIALALEEGAGASSAANDTKEGWMLRAAVAAEAAWGGSGAEENRTYEGLLKRAVDALEIAVGEVGDGSLANRLAQAAPLSSFLSFTRGSLLPGSSYTGNGGLGTRFNAAGTLVASVADQPRLDYDPVTLASRGIIVEPAATNNALQSAALNNAAWGASNVTVTANAETAPDGAAAADRIVPAAPLAGGKFVFQQPAVTLGDAVCFSIFAKAEGYRYAQLIGSGGVAGTFHVNIDLQTGVETAFAAGTSTVLGRGIEPAGSGWYRVWVAVTALATGNGLMGLGVINAAADARNAAWASDGASGILAWGGQHEQSSKATSHIPTVAAPVTRTADALEVTIPADWTGARVIFDDGSTQDVAVAPGAFAVPTNLNRARIKNIRKAA